MKKRFSVLVLSSIFSLCSCVAQNNQSYIFSFKTFITQTYYSNQKNATEKVKETIRNYGDLFSRYDSHGCLNNVYTINTIHEPVPVSSELFNALKEADSYIEKTNGYFNPYIGYLSDAWKEALDNSILLSNDDINEFLEKMNNTHLIFDEENLTIERVGDGEIDLGAFGKGYTLSIVQEYLKNIKIDDYLINAGNSSIILGVKPRTKTFNVGLSYIDNAYLKLSNTSIGTSAIYEQLTTIEGQNYSHVVNPFTGSTIPNYDMVTVIHENPTLTDVFSTAFMSMTLDEIQSLEKEYNLKVVVSNNHNIIYKTNSLEVYYH